jgi:hypothetical protein
VSPRYARKLVEIRRYDIVLTAAAHTSVYLGLKVDVFEPGAPPWIGEPVHASGEILVVRPGRGLVNPLALWMWLRQPATYKAMQEAAGAGARHLYASHLESLPCDPVEVEACCSGSVREQLRRCLSERQNIAAIWRDSLRACGVPEMAT